MIVVGALVVSFAVLVTVHVMLAFGLAFRPPRWRGLVALVLPVAGVVWGWREKMRVRAGLWVFAAVTYAIASIFAR